MPMEPLKAILVDDERDSREVLAAYLGKYCPEVSLKGMGASVAEGLELIKAIQPDVVFLDVEMPFGNGFDLLEQVDAVDFETVFVTAFSHYAVKALNLSAAFYILKPIEIDELVQAVQKIVAQRQSAAPTQLTRVLIENLQAANHQGQKVVLPLLDGFEVVAVPDVVRIEANDNFSDFYLTDGTHRMICRTLKHYEETLATCGFLRVHKSHIVNLQHVKRYKKGKGGQLHMVDGAVVEVSPARKKDLLNHF